jgi:PEP-CTERM motif
MRIPRISLTILKDSNCLALMLFGAGLLQASTVTFTDSTFDLSDYSITTFQSGGGTISVSQTTTAGNPPPAMQVITTVSGSAGFLGLGYFLNPSFTYNPGAQGAVTSINFSEDINFSVSGFEVFLAAEGASSVIYQNGNLYIYRFSAPVNAGVWETVGGTILQSNYDLITNVNTLAVDSTQHPNFASGPMEFGFISAWDSPSGVNPNVSTELFDNFTITVDTASPEPATFLLLGTGLAGVSVGFIRRRKRELL